MNRKTCSALFYKACEALPGSAGHEQFSAVGDALSPLAQVFLEKEKEHLTRLQFMERELLTKGCGLIAGVDEAGRGPLAGPVIAAAAAFRELPFLPFVNDSKLLGHDERKTLLTWIEKTCYIGIGQATHEEIDLLNIHRASLLAMARAVDALPVRPGFLLIDGRFVIPGLSMPQKSIIKGDRTSFSIACASIAAKVTRDRIMEDLHLQYPHYGFARHMGYPTKEHCKALEIHGPCAVHRKSYGPVRACSAGIVYTMKDESGSSCRKAKSTHVEKGRRGEKEAARQLISRGYEILERNFRTTRGEIDIIARHKGMLIFVEVKTRKNALFGTPQEAVDPRKQGRLRNMARYYLYSKRMPDALCRFDVVSVTLETGTVEVIEDAF